jgi:ABC-type branched-subunit amino acid transport system permease subunit
VWRRDFAAVPPSADKPMGRPMRRAVHGLLMTLRAATPAHADLRSRIVGLTVVSIVMDLVCAALAWELEQGHGEITTFGNALFWTTTQMLTVSSQFPNPLTAGGKILDVWLELYAITVVTALAGAFASFFHHRSRERRAGTATTP